MPLLVAGYWPTTYWAEDYWIQDYWPEYGAVGPPVVTTVEGTYATVRKKRLPYNVLKAIRDWLEVKSG